MSPIDYHNETKGIYSEEYYFNSDITNKDINNILCPDDNKDKKEFINILKNRYNNIKNVVIRTIKDCFKLA